MAKRYSIAIWLLLVVVPIPRLHAQACCSAGPPLLSSLELPPTPAGNVQFSLSYRYNALRDVLSGTTLLDDNTRQRTTHSVLLESSYGISSSLSVTLLLTLVQQERSVFSPVTQQESILRLRGVGDAILLLKRVLVPLNILDQREISVGVGGKIPFGSSTVVSDGILAAADMQPGTGAWDGVVWLYASQGFVPTLPLTLFLTSSYRLTGTNNRYGSLGEGYRFGNEFISTLGAGYRTDSPFDYSLAAQFRHVKPDQSGSFPLPNTGGSWLTIIPGVNAKLTDQLTIRSTVDFPVYRNLIGTQLTTTFAAALTIFYSP